MIEKPNALFVYCIKNRHKTDILTRMGILIPVMR